MGPFSLAGLAGIGSMFGDLFGDDDGSDYQQRLQMDTQREFAQNGIRWRVEDAKAAGLHPLAAIGAAGASYSPVISAGGDSLGDRLGGVRDSLMQMGQNTKRAEVATMTPYEKEMEQLSLERAHLQNRLLEGQIQNEWAALMGSPPTPSMPAAIAPRPALRSLPSGAKVGPTGQVNAVPSQSISSAPNDGGLEAGGTPGFKDFGVSPNVRIELPNQQLSESLEGMGVAGHLLGPVLSAIRQGDLFFNGKDKPSSKLLPPGYKWEWSITRQGWFPVGGDIPSSFRYNPSGLRGRN